jgi:hypothetical protein
MKHETKRLAIQDIVWKIKQVEIPQQNGQNLTKKVTKILVKEWKNGLEELP